ncbi:MAG: AAA family ATPase [Pikeienuella sp.]
MQADEDAIRQHLEWLFGGYLDGRHDGLVEIAWTDAESKRLTHAALFTTDQLDEAAAKAVEVNSVPNQNVYVGAALRKPGTAPFARTNDTDFYALPAYYVDLDDPGAADAVKDKYQHCPPQLAVVTGKEPHTRAQLWWRPETPNTDPAHTRQVMENIADCLGGDRSVANPGRVMRLGGSVAWPVKKGRTLERTELQLPAGRPAHYFDGQIERAFVVQRAPEAEEKDGKTINRISDLAETGRSDDEVERLLKRTREVGQWHSSMRDAIATMIGRGYSDWTIRHIVAPYCSDGAADTDLTPLINGGRKKFNVPNPGDEEVVAPAIATDPGRFSAAELAGEPKPREWIVDEWIPKGTVTALYGDGGTGKTLIAQQLAYARAVEGQWLGISTTTGRTTCVLCEDDRDELHRRHNDIKAHYSSPIGNPFDKVTLWPRVGFDNMLVTFDKDQKPVLTPFFEGILKAVQEDDSDLLILDTAADLFGGNEIIRKEVNYFIKSVCGRFIRARQDEGQDLTVLLLAHPSVAGMAAGTGSSGSTAWNNSVRSRLYLTRPENGFDEQRIITRVKSNYSASGDGTKIDLWWENGVLKPAVMSTDAVTKISIDNAVRDIVEIVKWRWENDEPLKAKRGNEFFLDTYIIDRLSAKGVPKDIIAAALKRAKESPYGYSF